MSSVAADAASIIRGLKAHFGVESDDALASKIRVAKSTIATWRRRGSISPQAAQTLARDFGITLNDLQVQGKDELRSYVLRQAFYYVIICLSAADDVIKQSEIAETADQLAIIDPFLRRAIARAAAGAGYEGLRGATSFLLDLRSEKILAADLMTRAIEDRRRRLTEQGEG